MSMANKRKLKGSRKQVIDKLQTFMKIIINEQSPGDTSVTKNNNNTRNLTPVQTNDSNSKETPLAELQRKCTDYINPTSVNVQILEKTRSIPILLEPDTCEEIHISSDACNLDSITRQNLKSIENFENNLQDACHNDVRVNEHTESNTPNVTQYQNYPSAKENVVSIKQSQIDSELSDNNKSSSINMKDINSKNKMTKRSKPKNKSRTDLSWIENIRFVREICADEHTHTDIQDNFWTDLSLPDTCDFDDK
ncbi:uncharacterized protein LOC116767773 isoform X2 [Danaus plexippus]|uniref:uncharacterized protein LOC116767773 isoform X2 n=1 Tax=Danaus plexippus TaxID=13037 RepID=UPI002AAFCEC5|nr:uncharacterized protein LOC116767773 isoform X2 [Danaus plexippus]